MKHQDKYLREPYKKAQGDFRKEIKKYASPDKLKNIIVSHCWEYRMGANACLFHLTDNEEKIIEDFTPHTTNGKLKWNEDSNTFGIFIGESERGILLMNVELKDFTLIKTDCWNFDIDENTLKLFIPQKQIDQLNSDKLFGGRKTELPRIKYEKPEDIHIDLKALNYFKKNELLNIFKVINEDKIELLPIENGFWEFNGKFPTNTYNGFNNRDFEVYQLEAFAKYGDEQSVDWLKEIKAMKDKKYNKWSKVSYYLGEREKS